MRCGLGGGGWPTSLAALAVLRFAEDARYRSTAHVCNRYRGRRGGTAVCVASFRHPSRVMRRRLLSYRRRSATRVRAVTRLGPATDFSSDAGQRSWDFALRSVDPARECRGVAARLPHPPFCGCLPRWFWSRGRPSRGVSPMPIRLVPHLAAGPVLMGRCPTNEARRSTAGSVPRPLGLELAGNPRRLRSRCETALGFCSRFRYLDAEKSARSHGRLTRVGRQPPGIPVRRDSRSALGIWAARTRMRRRMCVAEDVPAAAFPSAFVKLTPRSQNLESTDDSRSPANLKRC